MNKAIILHGTMSDENGNWFQWLKGELEGNGYKVWVPHLPSAESPSLNEWTNYIFENTPFEIDHDTLIVGHSSGAVAALFTGQLSEDGVGQVISVGSYKDLDYLHEKLNFHANDQFFDIEFDFGKIRSNVDKITFIHSDNDPYCPLEHAEFLADQTGGELKVIPGQGHFNLDNSPNYRQFPELLEVV